MLINNRLGNYYTPATQSEYVERAVAALEFCEIIMRIHVEAGSVRDQELASLTRLEMWASGVLRENGYRA